MGRPPSNGGPTFRFNSSEVMEMETILQAHKAAMPAREVLEALAQKFSASAERSGKLVVQMKQVWHWFQNRRYALRAKATKAPATLNVSPLPQDDSAIVKVPQAPQPIPAPTVTVKNVPQAPQRVHPRSVQVAARNGADSNPMEFEAKSARDGAWYDVATFLSHRNIESEDAEVLVRFAGFGAEEDEWVNVLKLVRQRSLPCESSECVAVLQGDLILCFQEGKEQALYFDAHVLDAQRRRHDVRGCRCRFLVRYDHDQSEEIVPLRKVCRRPETDYRLQQLHALNESAMTKQPKSGSDTYTGNSLRVYPPVEATKKERKAQEHGNVVLERKVQERGSVVPVVLAPSHSNLPAATEVKVQQPKVAEIVNAGTTGNLNVPIGFVPQSHVTEMISGGTQVSYVPQGNSVQQPKDTPIISGGTLDDSNVPPGNAIQQPKVMETDNAKIQENSIVPPDSVQQPKAMDITNNDTLDDYNVTPDKSNVFPSSGIEQPKVTETVGAGTAGNISAQPDNVIQPPEVEEVVNAASTPGNENVSPVNIV